LADRFDDEWVEFAAVFPVTNPKTVDAAAAAGLVITEEASALLVTLQDAVVVVVGSGTISAEAKLVFNVAMCYGRSSSETAMQMNPK
jgi:hypothetical protein